ncbi:MAG TPA: hypothetical protein VGO87_00185 [Acidimicrobiia bacterium]
MSALRALKRRIPLTAGVVALAFAGFAVPAARAVPPVGRTIGNVITTTCGDSPVIVLSVIVCQLQLPASTPPAPQAA